MPPNILSALGARRRLGPEGPGLEGILARADRAPFPADAGRPARQGRRNIRDGAAFLKAAETILGEVAILLGRAEALADRAAQDAFPAGQRPDLQREFQGLLGAAAELGRSAAFHGQPVFGDGRSLEIVHGEGAPFSVPLGDPGRSPEAFLAPDPGRGSLANPAAAQAARSALAAARTEVEAQRRDLARALDRLRVLDHGSGLRVENLAAAAAGWPESEQAAAAVQMVRLDLLGRSAGPAPEAPLQAILALLR